jgi:hypothetical protein
MDITETKLLKKSMDMKRDMMSLLKAAWGILDGVHDHEQSGVAIVESWRVDKLEEELAKWEGWYLPLDRDVRYSPLDKEKEGHGKKG